MKTKYIAFAPLQVFSPAKLHASSDLRSDLLLILAFILFFAPVSLFAQTKFMASASPKGITVLITEPPLHAQTKVQGGWVGFNIYRANEKNGTYKLLTKKPFGLAENSQKFAEMVGKKNMENFKKGFKASTDQAVWEKFLELNPDYILLGIMNLPIGHALGLVYDDKDVKEGQTYYYKVSKVRQNGSEGETSEIVEATEGKPSFKTMRPTQLKYQIGENGVVLQFSKAEDNTFRYVYRSQDSLATYLRINSLKLGRQQEGNRDIYVDTTARLGNKYYYTVASADPFDNLVFGDTISVRIKGNYSLPAPEFMSVTTHRAGVEITWKMNASTDSVAGFDVLRRPITEGEGLNFVKVNPNMIPANVQSYVDQTAEPSTRYEYVIRATAKDGLSWFPSVPFPFLYNRLFDPLPPENAKAEPLLNAVKISWSPSPDKDVIGYAVFRGYKTEKLPETITDILPKETLSFTDTAKSLSKNITFAYYIKAYTPSGYESPFTKPVFASPLGEPHKPARMNALKGVYTEFRGNRLKWNLPMDRETQSIRLFRAEMPDTTKWERIYTEKVIEGKFAFDDTVRNPVKTYAYKLCAVSYDSVQSDFSDVKIIEPVMPKIAPPTDLNVQQNGRTLKISWLPVLDENLKAYVIYRRTYKTATKKLAEVPKGTLFFEDKAETNDTYYYIIKSLSVLGEEGLGSKEVAYEVEQ